MINQHYLDIQHVARYYTAGTFNENTRYVIIGFHGYGQLGKYFIQHFDDLPQDIFVIVPEGLQRFYLNGMSGRVGASWMTKEDREMDIENQSKYINELIAKYLDKKATAVKLLVFGFSQGVSTAIRWMVKNEIKVDSFYSWAGSYPLDLSLETSKRVLSKIKTTTFMGDEDPYFNDEARQLMRKWLMDRDIIANEIDFKGVHKVYPIILKEALIENLKLS